MSREEAVRLLAATLREAREAEDRMPVSEKDRLSKDARIADLLIRYLPANGLSLRADDGSEFTA